MKNLEWQIREAKKELQEMGTSAKQVQDEYTQLTNWAELYDNCSFGAEKIIVAQFLKSAWQGARDSSHLAIIVLIRINQSGAFVI